MYVHGFIAAVFYSIILNGMYPRMYVFAWAKAHGHLSIEFEERGSEIWVLVRTWESSTFRHVCVAVLSRFSGNTTLEVTFLAKIVDAAGLDTSVVSLHGGPHVLAEAFARYLGSGYQAKLVEYPIFDLRLLKRCLQLTAASVFGSLDPLSMTEFVVNRLKGAETGDWMASRPVMRKAIITNDLSMQGFVDVVANIVGVWPLIVSYLKETGRKDDGDSHVVRSSTVGVLSALCKWPHHFSVVLEERDGRVSIPQSTRADEVQAVPSSSRNLKVSSLPPRYDPRSYVVVPSYCLEFSRNTLVPFHDDSTFDFSSFSGGILDLSHSWVMVIVLRCPSHMFLFQLSTISFILKQRGITGTTRLANWLVSSIVFCRK